MPLTLYFIRHGETDWNRTLRLQGTTDIPLNEVGRAQARTLAQGVASLPIGAVISSDLERARHTAEAVAQPLGLEIETDEELRERGFGRIEGVTRDELRELYGDELESFWEDPDRAFEGGESRREVQERVAGFLRRLLADPPADAVALVSHGGTIAAAIHWLERAPMQPYQRRFLGNCSLTTVVVERADAGDGIPEVSSITFTELGEFEPVNA